MFLWKITKSLGLVSQKYSLKFLTNLDGISYCVTELFLFLIKNFEKHIENALEHNLPVIVHSREAEKDTKEILYSYKKKSNITGVIHCFTGSEKFAREMVDIGFFISFSGIITFKNSSNLREIVSIVDKNKILVETDSPFLAPVPRRGKTNVPSFIIHTIKQISDILEISEAEVEKITSNNFFNLFKNVKASSIL